MTTMETAAVHRMDGASAKFATEQTRILRAVAVIKSRRTKNGCIRANALAQLSGCIDDAFRFGWIRRHTRSATSAQCANTAIVPVGA